jgi:hypothetical protein
VSKSVRSRVRKVFSASTPTVPSAATVMLVMSPACGPASEWNARRRPD